MIKRGRKPKYGIISVKGQALTLVNANVNGISSRQIRRIIAANVHIEDNINLRHTVGQALCTLRRDGFVKMVSTSEDRLYYPVKGE